MDDTRDVTQNGEQDVDEEISIAASLKEHSERGEDDGKNDLANIAVKRRVSFAGAERGRGRNTTYDAVKGILNDFKVLRRAEQTIWQRCEFDGNEATVLRRLGWMERGRKEKRERDCAGGPSSEMIQIVRASYWLPVAVGGGGQWAVGRLAMAAAGLAMIPMAGKLGLD